MCKSSKPERKRGGSRVRGWGLEMEGRKMGGGDGAVCLADRGLAFGGCQESQSKLEINPHRSQRQCCLPGKASSKLRENPHENEIHSL